MSKPAMASKAINPVQSDQLERGLSDLRCACVCLDNLIANSGAEECVAVLALIQKAGALIESSLREAAILTGPAVVGTAADWLDMVSGSTGNESALQ